MNKNLGIIFPVCDGPLGDEKHFGRFMRELQRLGRYYAVHFDHCSRATKEFFSSDTLCIGYHYDDAKDSYFDEASRQSALDVLKGLGFKVMLQLDVDETLEKKAPEKIINILDQLDKGLDVVGCPILDLWDDAHTYRVDGPFGNGGAREKFFKLEGNKLHYPHATAHAPNVYPGDGTKSREEAKVAKYPLFVLHWGIMDMEDIQFHTERWNRIYGRKVGGNPYGFYQYINDPSIVPELIPFNYDTWEGKTLDKVNL